MANILDAENRNKAAGIHLFWSMGVAIVAAVMVFALWYPWPYRHLAGGQQLFLLVVGVDLVMGPVLTWSVFKRSKPRRVMFYDLAVIVALQLAALGYGLHTVYIARPIALVYEGTRFRVVSHADVVREELPLAPVALNTLSLSGPVVLGTRSPKDEVERVKSIELAMAGIDVGRRPSFWQAYAASAAEAAQKARPMALLYQHYPQSKELIDQAVAQTGQSAGQLKFIPVISMRGDWSILLDAKSGAVAGFVPLEGFF
jgi:hypothetical protein